jgi:ferrous iron transport protein A
LTSLSTFILPLECLAHGEKAIVEDVHGEPGWVCRMAEMGIRNGSCLQVVQPGSPCLLEVSGCRLCLRGDESMRILVRPVR